MSLRLKVALAMATMALAVTGVFGLASYRSNKATQMAAVDRSLSAAPSGPGRDRDRDRDEPRDYQYLDRAGNVLKTTFDPPAPIDPVASEVVEEGRGFAFSSIDIEQGEFRVRTEAPPGADFIVQVFRPLEETNQILSRVRLWTSVLVVSISAFAALLGWWFAGRLTGPLRRLTLASEHVASTGDLDVEVTAESGDEVGRLANGFNSMLAALRRSRDDQQRLVQDAGHELRTPLTSLRTNVALLQRYPDLDSEPRQQILADLESETDELTALVNEIVAIASGALDDEPVQTLDLREVADEVAARFERRTERRVAVSGVERASIVGRPKAINRAVSCLVENACKFDRTDGQIDIEVDSHGMRVLDRGPGLNEVDASLVFDRFYRAESSKSLPGSGLGLSIVKQVTDRHGGTATAADRVGGGAVFEISFAQDSVVLPEQTPARAANGDLAVSEGTAATNDGAGIGDANA